MSKTELQEERKGKYMVCHHSKIQLTSSNVSPKGLEIASLISWATSCCSVISCIRSSILSRSLRTRGETRNASCRITCRPMNEKTLEKTFLLFSQPLTCSGGPASWPWQQSPYSSGLQCWCASSPELPSETRWWIKCHQSERAAAPNASSSSGPAVQLER